MQAPAHTALMDPMLLGRAGALERAAHRWHRLAHGGALAFVAMLYANPMYWWPWFERLRLGFLTMAVCAAAVIAHRLASGERSGWAAGAACSSSPTSPSSRLARLDARRARHAARAGEAWKMAVVFVAVQNALDAPSRLRRFLLVAALASLGPALGGDRVWLTGDPLVEGFRTHWRGLYADPNRLAMSLVAVLPFALYGAYRAAARPRSSLRWRRGGAAGRHRAHPLPLGRDRRAPWRRCSSCARPRRRRRARCSRGVLAAGVARLRPAELLGQVADHHSLGEDASVAGASTPGGCSAPSWRTGRSPGSARARSSRLEPLRPARRGRPAYVAHNILLEIVGDLGVVAFAPVLRVLRLAALGVWRAGDDPLVGGRRGRSSRGWGATSSARWSTATRSPGSSTSCSPAPRRWQAGAGPGGRRAGPRGVAPGEAT